MKNNRMRPIYNYPIVPDEAARHRGSRNPPVFRGDLGTDFRNALQFGGADWRTSPLYRQLLVDARLGSALGSFHWYTNLQELPARHEDLSKPGKVIDGWEEAAQRIADMGLFILAINSMAVTEIPPDIFDSLCRIFGKRFFGFNEGEWDGYYFRQAARGGFDLSPKRSREEACRHYLEWMGGCYARHQHRIVTCSSIAAGCHYAAELGTRMEGLELPQSTLPSTMILLSFCRGAARQYDLLFFTIPSVFSMRGDIPNQKAYPLAGQPQSSIPEDLGGLVGPEHGSTLGLMKRHWMLSYMSGASVLGIESGLFPCDARGEGMQLDYSLHTPAPLTTKNVTPSSIKESFTPLGWLFWECSQMAKKHPMRGVSYQPVALMLPFAHGWAPTCG
ncbi:MAG: hypothetical protein PHR35_18170, partial [Kiritimatiellae bacterium]|nr:hypothetical protein [Kiritimatiellia bacterium]